MDFVLSQEQVLLQKMGADFAEQQIRPHASEWDEKKYFPKSMLKEAAKLGMAAMIPSEDIGGSALKRLDAVLVIEQLATACVSTSAYLSIHNMVTTIIDSYGSDVLRLKWGPLLADMSVFGSYCLTEPESGSDAAALKTRAEQDGDSFIINGSKAFISGGGESDIYLCMVRTGTEGSHHDISCILIEKNTEGLSFGSQERKIGWHNQPTSMLFFENCRVPKSNLVGEMGKGFNIALNALNGGRINIGACSLGGAQACLQLAKDYLQERKQFGKTLTEFQALRFELAQMATELHAARLMVYRAAHALDEALPDAPMYAAMAKKHATDIAFNISNRVMQLHGGYGCLQDYPVERFFRDLRINQVVEGTNEIMKEIIAKHVLEKDVL